MLLCHSTLVAVPNTMLTAVSFIPSTKPRDANPPEFTLSFNVIIAPPTYVTCQVDNTPVDVVDLSREVTAGLYIPSGAGATSPMTSVNVTLRTREAGDYQCTVSVFRASGENLNDVNTSSISVSG